MSTEMNSPETLAAIGALEAVIDPRGRLKVPIEFEGVLKSQVKWFVSPAAEEGMLQVLRVGVKNEETEVDPMGRMEIPGKVLRLFKGQAVNVSWVGEGLRIGLRGA